MHNKWSKIALIWLIALAVPAQAFAAVVMRSCDQSHQAMSWSVHAQPSQLHHTNKPLDNHQAHQHKASTALALPQNSAATPTSDQDLKADQCSACASCCLGSTMVSPALQGFITKLILKTNTTVQDLFTDHAAEQLDPPPRLALS